jgi:chromosome segregation ATPase
MHKTLQRQIDRYLGSLAGVTDAQLKLFEAISKTYSDYEKDYALVERSLDLSSKELSEVNNRIRSEADTIKERATELEKLNGLMINRELKMVELKERIRLLQQELETLHGEPKPEVSASTNVI